MESDHNRDPYLEFADKNPELAARIQAAVDRGRKQLEQGSPDEARREFQRALALYPHVPAALNNLALLAYGDGDRERAKSYLEQLLQVFPTEPTANALMARYWLEMRAHPVAHRYAEMAVQSVISMSAHDNADDPSRLRRAIELTCQVLVSLEDDALLVQLYVGAKAPVLMHDTLVHIANAFYNRGYFSHAVQLWKAAVEMAPEESPARVYLEMAEIVEQHQLLPFLLDHRLKPPMPYAGGRFYDVQVSTLLVARSLIDAYRGENLSVDDALAVLTGVHVPGLIRILNHVARDVTRTPRIHLLAGLQMAAIWEWAAARVVLNSYDCDSLNYDDQMLWYLLAALLAEHDEQHEEAGRLAAKAEWFADGYRKDLLPNNEPFIDWMKRLAKQKPPRKSRKKNTAPAEKAAESVPAGESGQVAETGQAVDQPKKPRKPRKKKEIQFQLPDEEWLRLALQHPVAETLEELLAHQTREAVADLAVRLGEQSPENMLDSALVRRLAMRLRSLPLDRIVGLLKPSGRQLLQWLVRQNAEASLAEVYTLVGKKFNELDLWAAIEELYHTSLLDIGWCKNQPGAMQSTDDPDAAEDQIRKAGDLRVVVPPELRSRFQPAGK